jgi:hypothetical protein
LLCWKVQEETVTAPAASANSDTLAPGPTNSARHSRAGTMILFFEIDQAIFLIMITQQVMMIQYSGVNLRLGKEY